MRKFTIILIGSLLCYSCSHPPEQNKLVLLVDKEQNPPLSTQLLYLNDKDLLTSKECEKSIDTITLLTTKPYIELAVLPQFNIGNNKKSNLGAIDFFYFEVRDTVRISYQKEGYYTYQGKQAASQAIITQSTLLSKLYNQSQELSFSLLCAYHALRKQAEDPSYSLPPNFVSPDSLLLPYHQSIALANHQLDSLKQTGDLTAAFYNYYQYRLKQLSTLPIRVQRTTSYNDSEFLGQIQPMLSDSLCTYLSYWKFLTDIKEQIVKPSFGKRIPSIENKGTNSLISDQRQIFDALSSYKDSIPPRTLNLLRYLCLDQMRTLGTDIFSQADQEAYLKKYQAFSNDFLEQTPNTTKTGIDKLVGTPFRFFLYLLEFAAYTFIVLAVYRRWLRKRMGFVTRRVYLLLGLVASMLIPLFTIASQLRAIEKTEYWNTIVSPISEVLFCLYLLGCCVLLYEMARWLWQVEKMRRNSWRIPNKRYTLCILTDIECEPTIFGRKIFVSWNDWWHPKDKLAKERIRDSETYRIDHWHTFDSLLLSVVRIGCWGNPLLYCYNKELQKANDMAASNYAYCNRATMLYTATQEARELDSGLILGLAGSECTQKNNRIYRWVGNVKYQLLILLVIFIIAAILIELVGTISRLSETSFFG